MVIALKFSHSEWSSFLCLIALCFTEASVSPYTDDDEEFDHLQIVIRVDSRTETGFIPVVGGHTTRKKVVRIW